MATGSGPSSQHPLDVPDELVDTLRLLSQTAEPVARRHGIGDFHQELLQATFLEVWTKWRECGAVPHSALVEQLLTSLAKREQRSRSRTRSDSGSHIADQIRPPPPDRESIVGSGVPRLFPRLIALGRSPEQTARLAKSILAVSTRLAMQPAVMKSEQFRLFISAYVEGRNASSIAESLGISPTAVTKRLQRMLRRIERPFLGLVAERLEPRVWASIADLVLPGQGRRNVAVAVSADRQRTCELLLEVLDDVIHQNPARFS